MTAIDVNAGTVRWQRKTRWPLVGGALVTAGDVLFYGEGYPLAGSVVALGLVETVVVAARVVCDPRDRTR